MEVGSVNLKIKSPLLNSSRCRTLESFTTCIMVIRISIGLPELTAKMKPYLLALQSQRHGYERRPSWEERYLPIGEGARDTEWIQDDSR
jgi:hypothetical protein